MSTTEPSSTQQSPVQPPNQRRPRNPWGPASLLVSVVRLALEIVKWHHGCR